MHRMHLFEAWQVPATQSHSCILQKTQNYHFKLLPSFNLSASRQSRNMAPCPSLWCDVLGLREGLAALLLPQLSLKRGDKTYRIHFQVLPLYNKYTGGQMWVGSVTQASRCRKPWSRKNCA